MTTHQTELKTGDGRLITAGDAADLYRSGASLSIPSQGRIQRLRENYFSLTNTFSTIDCDTLESIKNFKVYSLNVKPDQSVIENVCCVSDTHEVSEIARATSENGRFMARLKSPSGGREGPDGSKRQLLEIWERDRHLKTIDTSEFKGHGTINADPVFGSFAWSKSGEQDKLLYVCQAKKPKHMNFFKEGDDKNSDAPRGEEYNRREHWGEGLGNIEHTMVAVLDVGKNFNLTLIDVENYSLANPQWLDNSSKVVSVAYLEGPRRLGLIYCNNRPSKLIVHDWLSQKVVFEFASDRECFHSPRASNAGNKFIYLSNIVYGPHRHSTSLSICDIRTGTNTCLASELFIEDLPPCPFATDDSHVLFTTANHLYQQMNLCNVNDSKIINIKFPTTGITLLDFRSNIILASGSEINATPTLFVAVINPERAEDVVAWHQIEDCIHLSEVDYQALKIPTEDQSSFISAIYVKPNLTALREAIPGRGGDNSSFLNENQLPTVVIVHGGPHGNFIVAYMPIIVYYARLGLKTFLINFRGSTGVSEDYVQSLPGKVGSLDVGDCLEALRYVVKNKMVDPKRLIIQGGSHGGFLSAHLCCQDEFKFTSAIIRNPVTDISSLHVTSDIPDWAYCEALGHKKYDPTWMPKQEELIKMLECSPMFRFEKANVPTLMLLGTKDLRVNMYQGERWFELLRARGVDAQCKVYPDKHDLAKPEVHSDSAITSVIFMLKHLP